MKQRFKAIVATHLLFIKENEVLLSLRHNTGYMDGYYSVVAGHADGGESIIAATLREAQEEADVVLMPDDLRFGCVLHRRSHDLESIDFFYRVNHWPDSLKNAEPDKCKELQFFSMDHLPNNIIPYVAHGIECTRRGIAQSTFGWKNNFL